MVRTAGVASSLHERGAATWHTATTHPMVQAIGAGTLPHESFHRYFTQNVVYLHEYARAIALTIAKAPDLDAIRTLTQFQSHIVEEEIPANLAFLERLGGGHADVARGSEILPTTYAYTRHLLAVCALGDCAEGLTAILPCQWSYGEIARPLMAHRPDDPIYADWISMFGNDEYAELVERTTALLDRVVGSPDERRLAALSEIFDRSTRYEAEFWDMAYGDPSGGPTDGGGA